MKKIIQFAYERRSDGIYKEDFISPDSVRSRAGLESRKKAEDYARRWAAGSTPPPIEIGDIIVNGRRSILDGEHRRWAASRVGKALPAWVRVRSLSSPSPIIKKQRGVIEFARGDRIARYWSIPKGDFIKGTRSAQYAADVTRYSKNKHGAYSKRNFGESRTRGVLQAKMTQQVKGTTLALVPAYKYRDPIKQRLGFSSPSPLIELSRKRGVRYRCPWCGLIERYVMPGVKYCRNDGSMMIPVRWDGSYKFQSTMKTTQLSARDELSQIIELKRGDYIGPELERQGWRKDPVRKRLLEAALYKPGYEGKHEYIGRPNIWKNTTPIPAGQKKIEDLLAAGKITPEQAAKEIAKFRADRSAQHAAFRNRAFIKADVETNASGAHNALHEKMQGIVDRDNARLAVAPDKQSRKIIKKGAEAEQKKLLAEETKKAMMSDKAVRQPEKGRKMKAAAVKSQEQIRIAAGGVQQRTLQDILADVRRGRQIESNIAASLVPAEQRKGAWRTGEVMKKVRDLRPEIEANAGKIAEAKVGKRLEVYKKALTNRAATVAKSLDVGTTRSKDVLQESSRMTAGIRGVNPVGALPEGERRERLFIRGRDMSKRGRIAKWDQAIREGQSAKTALGKAVKEKDDLVIKHLKLKMTAAEKAAADRKEWLAGREANSRRRFDQLSGGVRSEQAKGIERALQRKDKPIPSGKKRKVIASLEKAQAQAETGRQYTRATADRILGVGGAGTPIRRPDKHIKTLQDIVRATEATTTAPASGSIRKLPGVLLKEGKQLVRNIGRAAWGNRYGKAAIIGAGAVGVGAGALEYRKIRKKREEETTMASRGKIVMFAKKKVEPLVRLLPRADGLNPVEAALDKAAFPEWQREKRALDAEEAASSPKKQTKKRRRKSTAQKIRTNPDYGMVLRPMRPKFEEHVLRASVAHQMPYTQLVGVTMPEARRAGYAEPVKKIRGMLARKIVEQRRYDRETGNALLKKLADAEAEAKMHKGITADLNAQRKGWESSRKKIIQKSQAEKEALKQVAAMDAKVAEQAKQRIRRAGKKMAVVGTLGALTAGLIGGYASGRRRRQIEEREKQFSRKEKRGMNPYLMAGLSGGASGAVLGALPILTRGTPLKTVGKSMLASGLISGGIVGGGAKIGSKIIGEPTPDEGSAFTRRAAIGGVMVGAGTGLAGGMLLKSRGLRSAALKLRQAAKGDTRVAKVMRAPHKLLHGMHRGLGASARTFAPAHAIRKAGPISAAAMGAGAGGIYGLYQGLDEGQQVDSILNIRKDLKKMSSKSKPIYFSRAPEVIVTPSGRKGNIVATHRYRNKIEDEEWDRKEKNLFRSGITGGAVAGLLRKRLPFRTSASILGGIGAGAGIQAGIHASNPRDEYGDKSVPVKKGESLPWKIMGGTALGIAGIRGVRAIDRLRKAKKTIGLSSRRKLIQFGWAKDLIVSTADAHVTKAERDEKNRNLLKEVNRATRQATKVRRNVERTNTLIQDARIKLRGEKKLDERGRERKNEWDKSWVRNAALTAAGAGAYLIAKPKISKAFKEAEILRKAGKRGVGAPQLWNSIRAYITGDPNGPIPKTIAQRTKGTKWEPVGNAVEAVKTSIREAQGKSSTRLTKVADKLDELRTGKPITSYARPRRSKKIKEFPGEINNSSKSKILHFDDGVDLVPVSGHIRTRRRTKEELQKESLERERARHANEKQLIGIATGATGVTGAAVWNKYSPKAREQRRLAGLNQAEIAGEKLKNELYEKSVLAKHAAGRKRIRALMKTIKAVRGKAA